MKCQVCNSTDLSPVISLGDIPSANVMTSDAPRYPANVVKCGNCLLVQLDTIVDPHLIFPPEYPYTSGTTKSLRENFEELVQGASLVTGKYGKVLDIGSNDGTLLSAFYDKGWYPHGVEPTDQALKSRAKGIQTTQEFFTEQVAEGLGQFDVVTATNVFAHISDIHDVMRGILKVLKRDGVFITESTYWRDTVDKLQYDTIYHEHLRYYTLTSLSHLLRLYGLTVFRVERIPTMGGSIRVYAGHERSDGAGIPEIEQSVIDMMEHEKSINEDDFAGAVEDSRTDLRAMLPVGCYGIGAASRSTTLLNYTGIDLMCVCEIAGSDKIGKVVPGTTIPVVDEKYLIENQPENALILSWHIYPEIVDNLRRKGYRGKFIVPLPTPRYL